MIGHELLLLSGDSLSRVFPVEGDGDRYRIRFESEFQFKPEALVALIDSIVKQTGIAMSYLVEVEECAASQVVYSYLVGAQSNTDLVPCRHRVQPRGCYQLSFTILQAGNTEKIMAATQAGVHDHTAAGSKQANTAVIALSAAALLVLSGGIFVYFRKKPARAGTDPDMITIGASLFDKRNMTLSFKNEVMELTGKESDLLLLLYRAVNEIVSRDVILHTVWGDEGDYIGRTLDVFISKLRKKLEADTSLKIINIRGVGYKLIVN